MAKFIPVFFICSLAKFDLFIPLSSKSCKGISESEHIADKLNIFPRQSLKIFTFRVKSSDTIFLLLGLSPVVN